MFALCHIIICDALCLKNSSWFHCHYFLSCVQRFASSSVVAILQFHLENWPGFGMTINPANKAVYINPAREPDMNFIKFLTWTYNEYSCFYQHLRTSDISTFTPTKALSHHGLSQAAHKELSDRKKRVHLWHGMDLIPAFGLICLALRVIANSETLKSMHPKSDQHFTGVVSNKPIPVSVCLTPDLIQGNAPSLTCDWVLQALNRKIDCLTKYLF